MRDLQRATACAHALSSRTCAGAVAAAALRALAFLRRHAAPDAAAAARLAATGAEPGSGSLQGPRRLAAGALSVPCALATALEAAPELMAAAVAGDSDASVGAETAAGHYAYGVASALVSAAQIRAALVLADVEREGAGGLPGEAPVCCAQAFECLWPALGAAQACRCAFPSCTGARPPPWPWLQPQCLPGLHWIALAAGERLVCVRCPCAARSCAGWPLRCIVLDIASRRPPELLPRRLLLQHLARRMRRRLPLHACMRLQRRRCVRLRVRRSLQR